MRYLGEKVGYMCYSYLTGSSSHEVQLQDSPKSISKTNHDRTISLMQEIVNSC